MGTVDSIPLAGGQRSAAAWLRVALITALGLALTAYLLERIGLRQVLAAASSVGWGGFALLCAFAFVVFGILGPAWWVLLPRAANVPLSTVLWARMVRDAASEALPFSQLGGMVLGARAATVHGMPSRLAVASMIVDVTTELLGQLLYVGVGLGILGAHAAHTPLAHTLIRMVLVGLSLAAVGAGFFLALQRHGFRWVFGKLAGRLFAVSSAYTVGIAELLRDINRSPLRILVSASIHFCGWIAGAIGTWIAFRLVGVHIDAPAVIAIDSVVYAMRSVMFFVPNALGVQEAAYAVLGPLFGIDREFALAISLLKRARDIAVGIPILLVFQIVEGRRAFVPRMRA